MHITLLKIANSVKNFLVVSHPLENKQEKERRFKETLEEKKTEKL